VQNAGSSEQTPQYPIESVDRALRLLLMFREQPEIRLSGARDELRVGQFAEGSVRAVWNYLVRSLG